MLFKNILRPSSIKTKRIVLFRNLCHCREILRAKRRAQDDVPGELPFEKYDKELYNEFEVANSHITSDIDTHLEFLLNHVNLSDEKNHALIKMALFNKLLLMTLEGSKHHHLAPQSIKMETLNAKIDSSQQRLGSIKEESRMIKQYKKAKVMLQEIKNNSPGFQQAPAEIKEAEIKEDATKNQPAGPHAKQT